ncbi:MULTISPECIES: hypothetical protein [Streptococcus]|uniref:Anti-bacteriophage protein A/HamA C-terminal domain-containing protein n=1 Tax=Streptococcus suis TaxID=1307 RepID=A0A0Z8UZM4_STRSU|nr:hypothetical protein [Streptococcus suis]MDD7565455.1 hypothetical protein [Streptococcus suis]MDW8726096.1 hypothetical protein [Streptococcus suis]MDY5053757.1 hypothetical protein [Streptococcus suis]CYU60895.1 Uncharacterised protein [Streptococcus suis]CYV97873.1 Uncharacterised protein [Streptococcus suis]
MPLLNNRFEPISQVTISSNPVLSLSKNEVEVLNAAIPDLTQSEKEFIKEALVEIAKGKNSTYPVEIIARKIYLNLLKKDRVASTVTGFKDPRINSGFAAEFFLICILRDNGFEQQFCYKNLEENSPKKGFDGVYTRGSEVWLVESKSTHTGTHKDTIDRAYKGISDQLEGRTSNDPWENAASHVRVATANKSLVAKLEKLSVDYMNQNNKKLSECNLIIGSTVVAPLPSNNVSNIHNYIGGHQTWNEKIVVVDLSSQQIFIDIMEEIANG